MKKYLLFLGDSLTEWYDWERRFPACTVANFGLSGETVEEMLDRREPIRSRAGKPDYAFLMTGINNVLQEQYEFSASYRELVRNFTTWWKPGIVIVQSLLPVDYSFVSNDLIRDINRRLEAIAKNEGAEYLDVYSSFVDGQGRPKAGYLSEDGVHLAPTGYAAWSDAVEEYLNRAGEKR
ncbi:MAG: GDSL-type esterase/lipase family protein [Nitrospiraceae bacterium]|nr:GDSL-type esterase/lipase family protein [Nitrospiraceae bacterium]